MLLDSVRALFLWSFPPVLPSFVKKNCFYGLFLGIYYFSKKAILHIWTLYCYLVFFGITSYPQLHGIITLIHILHGGLENLIVANIHIDIFPLDGTLVSCRTYKAYCVSVTVYCILSPSLLSFRFRPKRTCLLFSVQSDIDDHLTVWLNDDGPTNIQAR